jgi:hypothetical protein
MATLTLNGTSWISVLGDLKVKPREKKTIKGNVRGGTISPTPRSSYEGYTLQLQFPYLSAAQLATLEALYSAQNAIAVAHTGFEFPAGSYTPTDIAKTPTKNLNLILYTVVLTLELDIVPVLPVPAIRTDLAVGNVVIALGL